MFCLSMDVFEKTFSTLFSGGVSFVSFKTCMFFKWSNIIWKINEYKLI